MFIVQKSSKAEILEQLRQERNVVVEDITLLTELWFLIRPRGYKHLAPNGAN